MTEPNRVERPIGRNEPCPCGSGKKYKRCCGVSAAPKLSEPKELPSGSPFDSSMLDGLDPQMLTQMTQAFQRLPKGQLQRMQALMQKAMNGKDITVEAQEFERSLPPDFQDMMKSWAMPGGAAEPAALEGAPFESQAVAKADPVSTAQDSALMTEEHARQLIAQAVQAGTISREQADALLHPTPASGLKQEVESESELQSESQSEASAEKDSSSKFGRFWKNISGKRNP